LLFIFLGNTTRETEDEDLLMAYYNNNRRSIRLSADDINSANTSANNSANNAAFLPSPHASLTDLTAASSSGISTSNPNALVRSASNGAVRTTSPVSGTNSLHSSQNSLHSSANSLRSSQNSIHSPEGADADPSPNSTTPTYEPPFDASHNNIPNGEGSKTNSNNNINFISRKSPVPRTRRANTTKKVVGTPDYLSPEILLGTGHGTFLSLCSLIISIF
jgi:hypothetical protein